MTLLWGIRTFRAATTMGIVDEQFILDAYTLFPESTVPPSGPAVRYRDTVRAVTPWNGIHPAAGTGEEEIFKPSLIGLVHKGMDYYPGVPADRSPFP
jgi:hypothetical protein